MRTKLILFLLCLFTLSAVSETGPQREKCATCGKLMAECPYHGNHPKKPEPKPEPKSVPVKKCPICAKPLSQGHHKQSKPRATCKSCKKPLSKCQYNGKHPAVSPSVTVSQGVRYGDHYYVDLGLPSGTKWATTNVGASSPSDYGDYYAWGETSTKSYYDISNLKYCLLDTPRKFSKYVTDSQYGTVDGKSELDPSDDAAYVNWGNGWRMPSKTQQDELREKCTWTWTTVGEHNGYLVVGPNGNSIYLPAAGFIGFGKSNFVGHNGYYWSRSLKTSDGYVAYYIDFNVDRLRMYDSGREFGQSIRPVLNF